MKVSSLILLEKGEIVLYNGNHLTVELEVLRFWGAKIRSIVRYSAMYKSALANYIPLEICMMHCVVIQCHSHKNVFLFVLLLHCSFYPCKFTVSLPL